MPPARMSLAIGTRRVVAWTCRKCGGLFTGEPKRRRRGSRLTAYVDLRCGFCRWAHLERVRTAPGSLSGGL